MKPNKQIDQINQMKRRNPVLTIALARKAGPMRDRRQRRAKACETCGEGAGR